MSKTTQDKLLLAATKYREQLLTGTALCVDPSSGSAQSQPGFAIYRAGKFVVSGTVRVTPGVHPARRYRELLKGIQELREQHKPDVLIIEKLPLMMGQAGASFNQQTVVNLHRSAGVVMAGADCERVLEVAPITWRALLRKLGKENVYVKTDENDAVMLGLTVFAKLGMELELRPELFRTDRRSK